MCDCDEPQGSYQTWRTARKIHACCECGSPILPGEQYEYFSGVWDHRGADFKTCAMCFAVREAYFLCLPRGDCRPCFGELWSEDNALGGGMTQERWTDEIMVMS